MIPGQKVKKQEKPVPHNEALAQPKKKKRKKEKENEEVTV